MNVLLEFYVYIYAAAFACVFLQAMMETESSDDYEPRNTNLSECVATKCLSYLSKRGLV